MKTNEGIAEPSAADITDPAKYKVEEVIYAGDDDDDPEVYTGTIGKLCTEIKIGDFVMARFFGPADQQREVAEDYMKNVIAGPERKAKERDR